MFPAAGPPAEGAVAPANPVVAKPGQAVELELLRGPNFTGELPEKLFAMPSAIQWRYQAFTCSSL